MEISTMNNGNNTISIEIAHGAYMLVEQLTADRYRVSLHSHHSNSFAPHSWVKLTNTRTAMLSRKSCWAANLSGMSSMLRVWHRYKKGRCLLSTG